MARPSAISLCLAFALALGAAQAARLHPERWYQERWCARHGGEAEVRLDDGSRVDCLTGEHAIEFDFADSWAESIGQALHYSSQTGRAPGVVLIIEPGLRNGGADYLLRFYSAARGLGIRLWLVRPEELSGR